MLDAVVIGSGPNGLSAAITLARAGREVVVYEAREVIGGGVKSAELTLPGFMHDVCSAVHPLAIASPFFQSLPLDQHGLEWIQPPAPVAHPIDDGPPVLLQRSLETTAAALGKDEKAWRKLFQLSLGVWPDLKRDLLGPLRFPSKPLAMAEFGLDAIRPAATLARARFKTPQARALFAGIAAHSILPLTAAASSAFGLVLALAGQADGWPIPRGGSQAIARALAAHLESLGGRIVTSSPISFLAQMPPSRVILLDLTPRQILRVAGERLTPAYRVKLEKYRYGPGVFKIDWALKAPIPWKSPECATAATVHLGGSLEEMIASEKACWEGAYAEKPYVLLTQPSLFDPSRAPAGQHTAWAYCHVPNGSTHNCTEAIERQVERFAPGFRDVVLDRHVLDPQQLEAQNANLVGGDIGGGAVTLSQLFLRPTRQLYATSDPAIFICSSSTPPGGGVHGMCGFHAAQAALKYLARAKKQA
ncbi:MAG TPA: NAD(P)/FAD-dependent oxidoreductase [Candidatus Methylacidiphilales bacterium]|jgi:phytoene dehydrogenase-like protein|nr:NAD(P)/FAD-dependent oxidoreductase [Candidatus Methylacidiphilales bacterium]